MVRRFSYRLQREAGCRVRSKCTRDGFSCLWGDGAAPKLAGRARRAALDVVGLGPIEERRTGGRILSFGAQAWCDVSAAASNAKPAIVQSVEISCTKFATRATTPPRATPRFSSSVRRRHIPTTAVAASDRPSDSSNANSDESMFAQLIQSQTSCSTQYTHSTSRQTTQQPGKSSQQSQQL